MKTTIVQTLFAAWLLSQLTAPSHGFAPKARRSSLPISSVVRSTTGDVAEQLTLLKVEGESESDTESRTITREELNQIRSIAKILATASDLSNIRRAVLSEKDADLELKEHADVVMPESSQHSFTTMPKSIAELGLAIGDEEGAKSDFRKIFEKVLDLLNDFDQIIYGNDRKMGYATYPVHEEVRRVRANCYARTNCTAVSHSYLLRNPSL